MSLRFHDTPQYLITTQSPGNMLEINSTIAFEKITQTLAPDYLVSTKPARHSNGSAHTTILRPDGHSFSTKEINMIEKKLNDLSDRLRFDATLARVEHALIVYREQMIKGPCHNLEIVHTLNQIKSHFIETYMKNEGRDTDLLKKLRHQADDLTQTDTPYNHSKSEFLRSGPAQ